MDSFSRRLSVSLLALAAVTGSFGGGLYLGAKQSQALVVTPSVVLNAEIGKPSPVDFSPFWKAWDILNQKFVETHGTSTVVTDQDKVWGAIKGLADSYGDPYTAFFPPTEAKQFETQISGSFEGIGMEVGKKNGLITVIAPIKDTPAYKAGLKSGDIVLKIDDKATTDLEVDQAVNLMRGKKGTSVRLTIIHENAKQPQEITIIRDRISIPTIDTNIRKDGVFVISLYSFSENSPALFRNAIRQFAQSGSNKLVLDLRGNPGGYLEAAVDMASWFLPSDRIVVREDTAGHGQNIDHKSLGYNVFNQNLKMVILVDGGSASASEILAGALQENGVATLVGAKTYGKGSVQELVPLTADTSLKITIARWFTPNGVSISDQGLTPNVEVKITPDDIDKKKDSQMDRAVQILLK